MKTFVLCSVMFFALVIFMLLVSGNPGNNQLNVKKDPSTLPAPSKVFEEWYKAWEKQR